MWGVNENWDGASVFNTTPAVEENADFLDQFSLTPSITISLSFGIPETGWVFDTELTFTLVAALNSLSYSGPIEKTQAIQARGTELEPSLRFEILYTVDVVGDMGDETKQWSDFAVHVPLDNDTDFETVYDSMTDMVVATASDASLIWEKVVQLLDIPGGALWMGAIEDGEIRWPEEITPEKATTPTPFAWS